MISLFRRLLERRRRLRIIEDYRAFSISLGDALSYAHMGDSLFDLNGKVWSIRDPETYHKLNELEADYSELGYRIVPLSAWIDYAGWGVSMEDLWLVVRPQDERPKFTTLDIKSLPEKSPIVGIVFETGKPVIGEVNDDGETIYRIIDND